MKINAAADEKETAHFEKRVGCAAPTGFAGAATTPRIHDLLAPSRTRLAGTSPTRRLSPHIGRVNAPLADHQRLAVAAVALDQQLVERTEIGLGGRHQRVRVGALRGDGAAAL